MMQPADSDFLIWWLDQNSWELCEAMGCPALDWPEYLRDQFVARGGRNGRGCLWADPSLGSSVAVDPWDDDEPVMKRLGEHWGGIVIHANDHIHISILPGVVTDMRCVPSTSPWERLHHAR